MSLACSYLTSPLQASFHLNLTIVHTLGIRLSCWKIEKIFIGKAITECLNDLEMGRCYFPSLSLSYCPLLKQYSKGRAYSSPA